MRVLSLFDGMSCAQIALERAGFKVDKYYASELDKYAVKVCLSNYPKTIQLGDVRLVPFLDLPKLDLLIGGSPCQGFSFAGKQLNFDDPRSKLFFEYVRVLKECKPKYFLLENVKMKKEFQDVISRALGVEPVLINSNLVSAQNRERLYWTNIPMGPGALDDKGIVLSDIVEENVDESFNSDISNYLGGNLLNSKYKSQANTIHDQADKIGTHGYASGHVIFFKGRGNNPTGIRALDGKVPCLTSHRWEQNNFLKTIDRCRKLTPIEFERLQTVPDNYTNHVSNTQRYKMLANGFTVDVIAYILKGMK